MKKNNLEKRKDDYLARHYLKLLRIGTKKHIQNFENLCGAELMQEIKMNARKISDKKFNQQK